MDATAVDQTLNVKEFSYHKKQAREGDEYQWKTTCTNSLPRWLTALKNIYLPKSYMEDIYGGIQSCFPPFNSVLINSTCLHVSQRECGCIFLCVICFYGTVCLGGCVVCLCLFISMCMCLNVCQCDMCFALVCVFYYMYV